MKKEVKSKKEIEDVLRLVRLCIIWFKQKSKAIFHEIKLFCIKTDIEDKKVYIEA